MTKQTFMIYILGEDSTLPVEVDDSHLVGHLKDTVKLKKAPELDDIAADRLLLYKPKITLSTHVDNLAETAQRHVAELKEEENEKKVDLHTESTISEYYNSSYWAQT